ncbi:hypothetical protein NDK43_20815 [Neobacillus pocheonensis]|uniref:Uncharacterized protein n=1 Tax=Neobacillus pocheonensis TaxID=363869 RepID=A0ABT0WDE4_9BACI|nr:hypothetical protein [Neobacillus pocheonensis]
MNENEYKSSVSTHLWSFALPGFGQVYNGQVLLGIIFMLWESGANLLSGLNLAIMESFHGDFLCAEMRRNTLW